MQKANSGGVRQSSRKRGEGEEGKRHAEWRGFGQSCFCLVSSGILFFGGIVRYIDNSIRIYIYIHSM